MIDDAGGRFAIDASTGVITVADTTLLDYETATSHNVTVRATSTDGSTSDQVFSISVSNANDAPTANDEAVGTATNTAVIISVLDNDIDPDTGDILSVSAITQGANGTVVINGDGTVTYAPDPAFNGTDTFTYTADDGNGGTDTATVTVVVGNVIEGGSGDDFLNGTPADNVMFGYDGDDRLNGLPGDDTLYGGAGDDDLRGLVGDDTLYGETGDDTLDGGVGDDTLDGGAGADTLDAANGDDVLIWDLADLVIDGGNGDDTLRVAGGDADLTTFGGTIQGIERVDMEADAGPNSLTLDIQDVLDLSDTDILTVLGDAGDSVNAGTGWADGGLDGDGNRIFTQWSGGDLATLLIDPDVNVNTDILT